MEIATNTATLFASDMAATDIVCGYFANDFDEKWLIVRYEGQWFILRTRT